ncbi:MAG: hypothetical protein JST04_13640 [Bdellovibrionales bacterium]|nr:hypothetical protein [Bdellovibrionales bacterium]
MRLSMTEKSSLVLEIVLAGVFGGIGHASANEEEAYAESEAALKAELGDCLKPPAATDAPGEFPVVNGHALTAAQASNVAWIARCVVPLLPGAASERAHAVALTTWWSLREGILDLTGSRAFRYSNCHENGADRSRSNLPMYDCPTSIWQVGLAAGQVANFSTAKYREVEKQVFGDLDPKITERSVLGWSAALAGFSETSASYRAIQRSTGRVRNSWLMRNPLIGMMLVGKENVAGECFVDRKKWCFGTGYAAAARFARDEAAMRTSVADLERYFALAMH